MTEIVEKVGVLLQCRGNRESREVLVEGGSRRGRRRCRDLDVSRPYSVIETDEPVNRPYGPTQTTGRGGTNSGDPTWAPRVSRLDEHTCRVERDTSSY